MTREELISHLEHLADYVKYSEDAPALREVIEMLKCSEMPNSSDTISRQAAIDFIDAGHLCNPNEPRWSDNEIVNFLKSRPSAQPEIIRCKECLMHGVCRFEQGLGLDGYCSQAERRTDENNNE